jgi:hypothetical protein
MKGKGKKLMRQNLGLGALALIYSIVDIMRFTRNKSRVYRSEMGERRSRILHDSISAMHEGRATLRQKLFLERYEAVKAAEEERVQSRNLFKRGVDWIFPGVQAAAGEALVLAKLDEKMYSDLEEYEETIRNLDRPLTELEKAEAAGALVKSGNGFGLLDSTAQYAVDATHKSVQSWSSWIRFW